METVIAEHLSVFGMEPNFIGRYWQEDQEKQMDRVWDSIDEGIPYDEYKSLSKEDRELWDKDQLKF
ncbi:MAG: hypothetical protein KAH30_04435 [Caldisericia bacterium]|nr:hypothetical protein [Caldisericia bacterium]